MCGIVGYIGDRNAEPILIKGLKRLEYRGYDSAGIAVFADDKIKIVKSKGKIKELEEKIANCGGFEATCGIGHTRWATHGEPSEVNSHPHLSNNERFAIVHNGIIENYISLKNYLIGKGYKFLSETDTEVVAHLVDYYFSKTNDMLEAVIKVIERVNGSYAFGILSLDNPDEMIAVRKDSPLIVGLGEGENFIASDIPAILEHTRKYYLLEDNEIVILKKDSVCVKNLDRETVQKEIFEVDWNVDAAEKGGYEHFMLKEIYEQPKALRDTISPRIKDGKIVIEDLKLTPERIKALRRIHIVACGSAWHVGMVAKYVIESLCRIPVQVDLASEFRYRDPLIDKDDLCIVISQSGETADTLAALREAKARGAHILSIVNVVGSSITRESDDVLYTWAGPEIAVATTKAYSTQLAMSYLFAIYTAAVKGTIDDARYEKLVSQVQMLPSMVEKMLECKEDIQYTASRYYNAKDVFFIGRGIDYAVALEGSLKLKEISYIHSEAYAAGELKHGTISLIENGILVIALATQEELIDKLVSNIVEVKSRGATILSLAKDGHTNVGDVSDMCLYVPEFDDLFSASLNVIPLQLLSYYIAVARGCDVDHPRNLAKSVTVE